ncbi:sensor histidine kinase [Chitinophaga vietnamensis]|uniref:sensor histidine kinase n=1 Tax=Chitinophaga vietnamensis TaxID=2593957 RepID=UPI001177B12F|nr:histidine kinase [Chitinophaga vietnamensis]
MKLYVPKLFYHLIFWIVFVAINYSIFYIQNEGENVYLADTFGKYSVAAAIFYSTAYFILPKFYSPKKYIVFATLLILVLILSFAIKVVFYTQISPHFGLPPLYYGYPAFFAMNFWWWLHYTFYAFGFWYTKEAVRIENRRVSLENEQLKTEYAYLKAKVDPHFLHNVLNIFYSRALSVSEDLADNIIILADVMRYSVAEPDSDGKVLVRKEIEQINNLIAINKLRFRHDIDVDFQSAPDCHDKRIIPFILITLVENAFKHGEIRRHSPLVINLSLSEGSKVRMQVSNKKAPKPNWRSQGIGLADVRKRLSIEYGSNYNLYVRDEADNFSIDVSIPC